MKRIGRVVGIVSLLVAPLAFAEGTKAEPAAPAPAAVAAPDASAAPKGTFAGSYTGNPNRGPWSPVRGSFQGTYSTQPGPRASSTVETSFDITDGGA
jgi:hypothetical protein